VALVIGVLLGVSIGEEGVVSDARQGLEDSLRGDLRSARDRNGDLRRELTIRDEFERQAYPGLVGDLLPGFRIGIVAMGKLPAGYASAIRDAVEPAGAEISSISVVRAPLALDRLGQRLRRTSLAHVADDSKALDRLGRRVGRQLADGGGVVTRVKDELFSSSRGEYRGLDAVVFARDRDGLHGKERDAEDRFESALLRGLLATDVELVGVETRDADPSQVPFMDRQGLTSVDDIDLVAGRAALVYALLGADGKFGVKQTADQLLPPPSLKGPGR
jgi:hypothetical protein